MQLTPSKRQEESFYPRLVPESIENESPGTPPPPPLTRSHLLPSRHLHQHRPHWTIYKPKRKHHIDMEKPDNNNIQNIKEKKKKKKKKKRGMGVRGWIWVLRIWWGFDGNCFGIFGGCRWVSLVLVSFFSLSLGSVKAVFAFSSLSGLSRSLSARLPSLAGESECIDRFNREVRGVSFPTEGLLGIRGSEFHYYYYKFRWIFLLGNFSRCNIYDYADETRSSNTTIFAVVNIISFFARRLGCSHNEDEPWMR
ncbi:hypothetical protein L228DRAFT_167321 [Xylona heveae TC161]|uniref:Uncharacterized protein n=1 Tax=Xylona heveae (strain CBS 132557 / TC161) TaxID=1328760 RepID=A0A165FMH4_XYLHT|nr:hypothetical protein L228DRAFT_167321 [Xylona heveae TC161]KZF21156.1 hypothetical protein L228DRAFT_167321 [Xylona heveae TC161]